jgi:hypothetical protein
LNWRRGRLIKGTSRADVLTGSRFSDLILAGGGSDVVYGRGGNIRSPAASARTSCMEVSGPTGFAQVGAPTCCAADQAETFWMPETGFDGTTLSSAASGRTRARQTEATERPAARRELRSDDGKGPLRRAFFLLPGLGLEPAILRLTAGLERDASARDLPLPGLTVVRARG